MNEGELWEQPPPTSGVCSDCSGLFRQGTNEYVIERDGFDGVVLLFTDPPGTATVILIGRAYAARRVLMLIFLLHHTSAAASRH